MISIKKYIIVIALFLENYNKQLQSWTKLLGTHLFTYILLYMIKK